MALTRQTPLFIDASCLIAAAGSPTGGSGFVLSLCERGVLTGIVSPPALAEAEWNIAEKLPPQAWGRYQWMLAHVPLVLVPVPPPDAVRRWADAVTPNDAHVVAAALAAGAEYLLTLDRPLQERVNATGQPLRALSRGGPRALMPTEREPLPYWNDERPLGRVHFGHNDWLIHARSHLADERYSRGSTSEVQLFGLSPTGQRTWTQTRFYIHAPEDSFHGSYVTSIGFSLLMSLLCHFVLLSLDNFPATVS